MTLHALRVPRETGGEAGEREEGLFGTRLPCSTNPMVAPEAAAADIVAGAVVCLPTVRTRLGDKEIKDSKVGEEDGERVGEEEEREREERKTEGQQEGGSEETKEAEKD